MKYHGRQLVSDPSVEELLQQLLAASSSFYAEPAAFTPTSRDAFSRVRTSDPETLFDSTHHYDKNPLLYEEIVVGGATGTHLPAEAAVRMRVEADGDSIVRQSRAYIRYQPGKSQLVIVTFDAGAARANARQRIGLFDAGNGVFLQRAGEAAALVRRTSTSGSPLDAVVPQADWNIDSLDGSGPSGLTLDLSKSQIFWINFQWLGVGAVTCGFSIDGDLIPVHRFVHANRASSVYATTMNLPVRWENAAVGTPSGTSDLKAICATVISEGGFEDARGFPHSASNGAVPVSVSTRRPILSIRPSATFNNVVNRAAIVLDSLDITASGNAAYWELVYGGTLATTPSWASAGSTSTMDVDTASTAISGGHVIQSGYVVAGTGSVRQSVRHGIGSRLPLTLDAAGANPIPLSVVVTSMSGSASVAAALNWRSLR